MVEDGFPKWWTPYRIYFPQYMWLFPHIFVFLFFSSHTFVVKSTHNTETICVVFTITSQVCFFAHMCEKNICGKNHTGTYCFFSHTRVQKTHMGLFPSELTLVFMRSILTSCWEKLLWPVLVAPTAAAPQK